MITADQIRAARALKNWSQTDLAERTGLAVPTIANIELGKQIPGQGTLQKIIETFETAGIEFIGERGVQVKQQTTMVFQGREGLKRFYDDIYESIRENKEDVFVGNADERDFLKNLDPESIKKHIERMESLKVHYKILICENDYLFPASEFAEYRWISKEEFSSIPFYVYADKMAIILWLDEPVVFLINDKKATAVYREKFIQQWKKAEKPPKSEKAIIGVTPETQDKIQKEIKKKGRK